MTTALTIIESAFDDLGIKPSETDLSTSEISTGIRRLNRLGTQFAAKGINVGFSKISSELDEMTVPDYVEDLFITTLALRLAPGFGVLPSQLLIMAANEAMSVALFRTVSIPDVIFPNTLPTGQGNFNENNKRFFTDDTENDLDGFTTLEDDEGVTISKD